MVGDKCRASVPAKIAHGPINGRFIGDAFIEDTQGFSIIGTGQAVDDKAGRVFG